MSTDSQIAAHRENAKHSTGPVTPEGKAAASQNHFKHGFCGTFRILHFEQEDKYLNLLAALRDEHAPTTPTESILVEKMAQHHWLNQRAQHMQSSLFHENHIDRYDQRLLSLYLRYQTTHERAFSKCLNELAKLRAEKRKQEIGFERQKQCAAQETRKQEAHETKIHLVKTRTNRQELGFDLKKLIESRLPDHAAIPSSTLKSVLARSLEQFAAELAQTPNVA